MPTAKNLPKRLNSQFMRQRIHQILLKDEVQHQDSRKNKVQLQTLQILHGNLNVVFPTSIKQQGN